MKTVSPEIIKERLAAAYLSLDIPAEVERHTGTRLSRPDSKKQFNGACPYDDCSADTNGFIVWSQLTERGCHYWCRQCRRMGDILKLVQDIKGLSFSEACKELGIPNPYREDGEFDDLPIHPKQHVPKVEQWQKDELSMLHGIYPRARAALKLERAKSYLAERNVPFDLAQEHGLGYIPAGGTDEKWCDRILFPVLTPSGESGYCGRSLLLWEVGMDEDAHKAAIEAHNDLGWDEKIHRWVDTYLKGFFNWQSTKDATCLVFVEGAFDVLACLASGIPNAIPLGTTGIDADMLPRNICNVVMALDVDASGRKAAKKLAFDLRYTGGVSVLDCTPPAKDWSAAYRLYGKQGLAPIQDALQKLILCSSPKCSESSFSSEKPFQVHEGKFYCWDCYQKVAISKNPSEDSFRTPEKQPIEETIIDSTPEIKPYTPVTLPLLPRKTCPFVLIGWNAKGNQERIPCKEKTLENGFCRTHQSVHELLEIGARNGYPETRIAFRWKSETLWKTIYAGVEQWEKYACMSSTDRPIDVREQDVKYLERQFTHAL